jgi:cytochrome oxidase Cu insertion factor (SCO1/SenC/PrrC family)
MSGNAWVCTIITLILLASGGEQLFHIARGDTQKAEQQKVDEAQKELDASQGPQLGQPAPDFSVPDGKGGKLSLASYRGKPLVLNFY